MKMSRTHWPIVILLSFLPCACTEQRGSSIEIAEAHPSVCRIEIRPTGVQLGSVTVGGEIIDVGDAVARNSAGRIFTSTVYGGHIMEWDSVGRFHAIHGRPGEGPGEFAAGPMHIYVDRFDSVFVRDNSMAFSVFDERMNFVRRLRGPLVGLSDYTHLLDDGTILSTYAPAGRRPAPYFSIIDRDGNPVRTVAPQSSNSSGSTAEDPQRLSTWGGDDSFWLVDDGDPGTYVLRQWSLDGERLKTLIRRADWLTPLSDAPLPRVGLLHQDSVGLIVVMTSAPNANWTPEKDVEANLGNLTEIFDVRMEVVDPALGVVVASQPVADVSEVPRRFFPRSRTGWRIREAADGTPLIQLVQLELAANEESADLCTY